MRTSEDQRPSPRRPHERRAEQVRSIRCRKPGADAPAAAARGRRRRRAARSRGLLAPRAVEAAAAKSGGTLRVGIGGGSPTDDFDMAHINGPSATTRGQVVLRDGDVPRRTVPPAQRLPRDEFKPNERPRTSGRCASSRASSSTTGRRRRRTTCSSRSGACSTPSRARPRPGQLGAIDLKRTKKLDNRTVRFVLKTPQSFFDYLLSDIVYLVPVGYDPKKPVSTGPWRFKSFQPGRQTVLTRFENYHGTPAYADQLVMSELPDDTARVNALISGQVDVINQVPFPNVPQLKGQSGTCRSRLADRRLEPDHHARRRRAVQRRARAPGDPPLHES